MWDWIAQASAAAATWLAGETGSRMAAGAAGGLMRWADQAQRRLIDGVLAAVSGSFAAIYLGPVVKAILLVVGIDLGDDTQGLLAAGFLAGLMGMSVAKVAIAVMETWSAQRRRAPGGDQDGGDHG